MRCKNCGTYNDDNRYICETCGSPLYDEEEIEAIPAESENTRTRNTSSVYMQQDENSLQQDTPHTSNSNEKNPADKKSIIVIAILAVVLIAIIASVAVVAHSKSQSDETTSTESAISQTSSQHTTVPKTERTTEPTTEPTTTTTTTEPTTTEAPVWYINANTAGGGKVKGSGEYKNGENVTVSATPDSDYIFDGWYSDGMKISSSAKYTFIANQSLNLTAVFTKNNTEPSTENEGIVNGNDEDINFGD